MSENTVNTILWAVLGVVGIQALTAYAICRLFVTGRSMFDRKAQGDEERPVARIHRADR